MELYGSTLFDDASLIAYYRLSDVSDSKGSNTLTNNGTTTFSTGKFGNAADFGTSNSSKYLNVAGNIGVAGNASLGVSFWVKLNAEIASDQWTFLHMASQTGADRFINMNYQYNAGTRRLQADFSGNALTSNITLGTSNYAHIVINRTTTTATELFVNGSSVATGTPGTTIGGANRFNIGFDAGTRYSDSLIDDMAVFTRVLTSTEVGQIYNGTLTSRFKGASFLMNFV